MYIFVILTVGYFFRDWMQTLGAVVSAIAIILLLHLYNKLIFLLVPMLLLRLTVAYIATFFGLISDDLNSYL